MRNGFTILRIYFTNYENRQTTMSVLIEIETGLDVISIRYMLVIIQSETIDHRITKDIKFYNHENETAFVLRMKSILFFSLKMIPFLIIMYTSSYLI